MHIQRLLDRDCPTMQAVSQRRYGPPNVLELCEVVRPRPGPRDVLVRVKASSVTVGDWRLSEAAFPGIFAIPGRIAFGVTRPRHPIGGTEFAGEVQQVGSHVTRFSPGDAVFGIVGWGAHAQYLRVSEDAAIVRMPDGLSYDEAAVMPYGCMTAWTFLHDLVGLRRGHRLLIVGASGGVGSYAVQVAKLLGARVAAVCSERNFEFVQDLGAELVFDYRSDDIRRTSLRFDTILDVIGATRFGTHRGLLTPFGRHVFLNGSMQIMMQAFATRHSKGRRVVFAVNRSKRATLATCADLAGSRELRPVIERWYPLDRIQDAHRHVAGRHRAGSVAVVIEPTVRRSTNAPWSSGNAGEPMSR